MAPSQNEPTDRRATQASMLERLFQQSPSFMAMLVGPEHRIELANRNYMALVGGRDVLGKTVAEALPDAVEQGYLSLLDEVYRSGQPYTAVGALYRVQADPGEAPVDHYVDFVYQPVVDEGGNVTGVFVDGFDVTGRHLAEGRIGALARLSAILGDAVGPVEAGYAASTLLGTTLGSSRVGYGTIDHDADTLHVEKDWHAPGVESLAGVTPLRDYGSFIDSLKEGKFIAIADTRLDPRTAPASHALEGKHARSFVNYPVLEAGRLVAVLFVNHADVRNWTAEDLDLIREVGARARSAVERATAEAGLRTSRDSLIEASRLKDEFLATLAHELRNPLAPIKNGLAILGLAKHDPDLVARVRELMERQVDHMTRLIEDLLDVSRLSRGLVELQVERIDLASAVEAAIEASRPNIDQRQHEFRVELPSEVLVIDADPTRVTQVVTNLLNNAAKFTPPGGKLQLALTRDGAEALLRVTDNGIGIAADKIGRIFEMFEQVDRSHAHVGGGLGIGLTLAKRLVLAQGGTIAAHSQGLGEGCEFTVRFPLDGAPAAIHEDRSPTERTRGSRRHRILVADDNHEAAQSLAMVLDLAGHETSVAYDGQEAIDIAETFVPTAAVLDIAMPRLDGLQAAKVLRARSAGQPLLLVALSGFGSDDDKARSLAAGFDAHLVKPMQFDLVEDLLLQAQGVERQGAA